MPQDEFNSGIGVVDGGIGKGSGFGTRSKTGYVQQSNCPTQAKGRLEWATFQLCLEMSSMWSTLWNGFNIWKSFKSCWIRSCYTPPTKPRSAPGETGLLWCATPCGNICSGWNCEPGKSATVTATRGRRKPTRKRGVGNRRGRGRKNSPGRGSALPVFRARQEATGARASPRQRHRVFIDSHGCSCHFNHSRRAIGGCSERGGRHEVPVRGEPAQCDYGVATAPGETCGPA